MGQIATEYVPYLLTDEWKQNYVIVYQDFQKNFWEVLSSFQR
jgi:hypothetical protein